MAVADLGDRPLPALFTRGALRGHQSDEGHQLLGGLEALEVADLADQGERGQGVDAAQAAKPPDQRLPGLLLGRLADHPLQLPDPGVDEVERVQVTVEALLLSEKLERCSASQLCRVTVQDLVGSLRPWRRQNFESR